MWISDLSINWKFLSIMFKLIGPALKILVLIWIDKFFLTAQNLKLFG